MARSASATVARNETELRLSGIPLMFARIGCVAIALFSLALFVPGLQVMYQRFQSTCATADTCLPGQLTVAQAATLRDMGVSVETYALFELAFTLLIALIWFVVAAVVLARKSDNWMVLLIVAQAFTQGATAPPMFSWGAISCGTRLRNCLARSTRCCCLPSWQCFRPVDSCRAGCAGS